VKVNLDEQHAIFVHELQIVLRLTVGFSNVYFEVQQVCNLNMKLKFEEVFFVLPFTVI
jgi:hypothetical protein